MSPSFIAFGAAQAIEAEINQSRPRRYRERRLCSPEVAELGNARSLLRRVACGVLRQWHRASPCLLVWGLNTRPVFLRRERHLCRQRRRSEPGSAPPVPLSILYAATLQHWIRLLAAALKIERRVSEGSSSRRCDTAV